MKNGAKLKAKGKEVSERLSKYYPSSECALKYGGEGWKLMVMGRLSAQCTDKRVNIVCEELFSKYTEPQELANAPLEELESIIRPCGLFHTKAVDIKEECKLLCEKYGGIVPETMEELLEFRGVGRKIANLLLGDLYSLPAIVADTHCIRISSRLGFTKENEKSPLITENTLKNCIEKEGSADFCHRIVEFGRDICSARSPLCEKCFMTDLCDLYSKNTKKT